MPDPGSASKQVLWRAYVPQWASEPLSGSGAARFGGRWNPIGIPAIYAARELSTAWAEYNQGFVQHPAVIAQLELTGARLADLTEPEVLKGLDLTPEIHRCEWRNELNLGNTPATHTVFNRLLATGFHGVIFASFMSPGGSCVALWQWNQPGAPSLRVVDPEGRLPKTTASWV